MAQDESPVWRKMGHFELDRPTFDNRGDKPIKVPGINGCDLDSDDPDDEGFCHGASGWEPLRLTVRELTMLGLMGSITDKPKWWEKVFNEEIVAKWHQEAVAIPLISEQAWTWCLAELRENAAEMERTKCAVAIGVGSPPIKSDTLIDESLRTELIQATRVLRDIPEDQKDYHPKSNDQVLNLVHPSLFPLVYGKTRVLSQGGQVGTTNILDWYGKGEVAPEPDLPSEPSGVWSNKFQWLPCEVEFTGEGNNVKITSYINNLHPIHHSDLYSAIEKLISISIEPWNQALVYGDASGGRVPARISTFGYEFTPDYPEWAEKDGSPQWNLCRGKIGDEEYEKLLEKVKEYLKLPNNPDFDEAAYDEDWTELNREDILSGEWENNWELEDGDLQEIIDWKYHHIRQTIHPDFGNEEVYQRWKLGHTPAPVIPPYRWYDSTDDAPPSFPPYQVDLAKVWGDLGLQVIVKIAGIELTPEKPEYAGGSWHLEGMLNEHIVATSIYYYDADNTTESRIRFRQQARLEDDKMVYEQGEHDPLCEIFGTESMVDEPAVQEIGSVATPQGRLLAFPNTLQHRVDPFRLEDPTRPGHRRFVVLWLIDPTKRIVSTRNVPPQRHDWWRDEAYNKIEHPLPAELAEMVQKEVGEWPMGMEEAKKLRLELMEERTQLMPSVESRFEEYNLCEH